MTQFNVKRCDIKETFKTVNSKRDNFLSRVFGIFNEDIVRLWCNNSNSHYDDLGRPSLYYCDTDKYTHTTLDFTLQNKETKEIFISEQKCELAYQNYRYLELNSSDQLKHHDKKAFKRFLQVAKTPNSYNVKIHGQEYSVSGSILIWGRVNVDNKEDIKKHFRFQDILSIENMINDLLEWEDDDYKKYINRRYEWMKELMSNLDDTLHIT